MNVLSSRLDNNISTTTNNFKLLGSLLFLVILLVLVILTLLYLSYLKMLWCAKKSKEIYVNN